MNSMGRSHRDRSESFQQISSSRIRRGSISRQSDISYAPLTTSQLSTSSYSTSSYGYSESSSRISYPASYPPTPNAYASKATKGLDPGVLSPLSRSKTSSSSVTMTGNSRNIADNAPLMDRPRQYLPFQANAHKHINPIGHLGKERVHMEKQKMKPHPNALGAHHIVPDQRLRGDPRNVLIGGHRIVPNQKLGSDLRNILIGGHRIIPDPRLDHKKVLIGGHHIIPDQRLQVDPKLLPPRVGAGVPIEPWFPLKKPENTVFRGNWFCCHCNRRMAFGNRKMLEFERRCKLCGHSRCTSCENEGQKLKARWK